MADTDNATPPATALTLHQSATLVGAYRWVEERLFVLTGQWSADPAMTPRAQVHLFDASARHGWHAELWEGRLPVLAGMDSRALTRPSGPAAGRLLAALEDADGPGARLVVLHRIVLPRLVATYRRHLARTSPVADRPVERVLRLVLAGLDEERGEGAALLAGMGVDAAAPGTGPDQRVTGHAEALDRAGAVGPGDAGTDAGPADVGTDDGYLVPWPVRCPVGAEEPSEEPAGQGAGAGHPGSATGMEGSAPGDDVRRA